jgi:hypothetical protein
VFSDILPLSQALLNKQQDPQDIHRQALASFKDLSLIYRMVFQSPALIHMNFRCHLERLHAAAFAVLGNQPFIGGGKASPPCDSQAAERGIGRLTSKDVGQLNRLALHLVLVSHVLPPLNEVLQQLLELRRANRRKVCSPRKAQKSVGGDAGGGRSSSRGSRGSGKGISIISSSSNEEGIGSSSSGSGIGKGASRGCSDIESSSSSWWGGEDSSCNDSGNRGSDVAESSRLPCSAMGSVSEEREAAGTETGREGVQPRQPHAEEQQQGKQQQEIEQQGKQQQQQRKLDGEAVEVVSSAQVNWLFFNMRQGGCHEQGIPVGAGRYASKSQEDEMPPKYLQCVIEMLLLLWPKPATPSTVAASSSMHDVCERRKSSKSSSSSKCKEDNECMRDGSSSSLSCASLVGNGICGNGGDDRSILGDGGWCRDRGSASKDGSASSSDDVSGIYGNDGSARGAGGYGNRGTLSSGVEDFSASGCGGGERSSGKGSGSNHGGRGVSSKGRSSGNTAKSGAGQGTTCSSECSMAETEAASAMGASIATGDMPLLTPDSLLNLFESPISRWPWIVTLAAMFQRASLEARLEVLEQREGTLLLQLLYQVMLEDRGLRGEGIVREQKPIVMLTVTRTGVDVGECLNAISEKGVQQVVDGLVKSDELVGVEVHTLVLLVLQCLLYKPLRADREMLEVLEPSRLMLLDAGEGCWAP